MGILKEFACAAHGSFEAIVKQDEIPKCPKGCPKRFVKREYLTAPTVGNVVTGRLDGLQKGLAHDFGLPDLKAGRDDGKSVMQNLRSSEDFSPKWVDVPGKMKPGWSSRGEKATTVRPEAAFGMQGGNATVGAGLSKQLPTRIEGRVEKLEGFP